MGKPDDIPQDVWGAAEAIVSRAFVNYRTSTVEVCARAILAERERCAKVAEDMERLSVDSSEWDAGYRVALGSAAAAIRNGGEA